MRKLASYSLEASAASAEETEGIAAAAAQCVTDWISQKGEAIDGGSKLRLIHDGRVAELSVTRTNSAAGQITESIITEPTPGGSFRTAISVANGPDRAVVSCELSAGSQSLIPLWVDVYCPKVIRDVLAIPAGWSYNLSRLHGEPQIYRGASGGNEFITQVWSPSRSVPVIAISEEYGLVLHRGITEDIAADLAGLAVVAQLDAEASWQVTSVKGKSWSCYGGAIRLYWPRITATHSPFDHPLWTARRLLTSVADTGGAAERIRRQLRRRILGQSAFAVTEPGLIAAIRKAARRAELAELRERSQGTDDYRQMAEEYFQRLTQMSDELSERDDEIKALKDQVANLQVALRWRDESQDSVEPVEDTPPSTVEDAVLMAMERFTSTLLFGAEVTAGVESLSPDAGPPDKVLSYLEALSALTAERRRGPLGTTPVKWLEALGVIASGESETVRTSAAEMQARTWDDGCGVKRPFEMHLKPNEGTAPDRCVRIYFDYDEALGKTIVAWVGRHP